MQLEYSIVVRVMRGNRIALTMDKHKKDIDMCVCLATETERKYPPYLCSCHCLLLSRSPPKPVSMTFATHRHMYAIIPHIRHSSIIIIIHDLICYWRDWPCC